MSAWTHPRRGCKALVVWRCWPLFPNNEAGQSAARTANRTSDQRRYPTSWILRGSNAKAQFQLGLCGPQVLRIVPLIVETVIRDRICDRISTMDVTETSHLCQRPEPTRSEHAAARFEGPGSLIQNDPSDGLQISKCKIRTCGR